jgi:hypothetical protein
VSKNSIRLSNQRCVVVHGTHNLTVSQNVAFDTVGHCYVLEDGGELDNKFVSNLGATTRRTTRLIRPFETDNSIPSTFWISNPANTWGGNVAAGSEGSGYWFELQDLVRSPTLLLPSSVGMVPRKLALQTFSGNIAHSNSQHGLRKWRQRCGGNGLAGQTKHRLTYSPTYLCRHVPDWILSSEASCLSQYSIVQE